MVHRNKGKFELEEGCLQNIICTILKQKNNKEVGFYIEKSPNYYSKSLYVRFYIGDTITSLRVSDHECSGTIRQLIVKESTGIANVYYKIDRIIRDLKHKRLQDLLRGVNNEFGTNKQY